MKNWAKPLVLLIIALVLTVCPLLGCNGWRQPTLEISEVKTSVLMVNENDEALAVAWYTPVETNCVLSYCDNTTKLCIPSDPEPGYGTLHLFTCVGLSKSIEYFIIRATDKNGETIEETFDNPLTK
jgi:hypothetical protein